MAETPQIFVGKSFKSYTEVSVFINDYETYFQQKFWKRSSRKITSTPNIKRHINPELVYYEITYSCIHGGEKFKSRSRGLRKAATFRLGLPCGAYIRLRASPDGRTLDVRALSEDHNHISVQDRWTVGQVDALIEEYKQYRALYDVNHDDYNNITIRNECLAKIAKGLQNERVGITEQDVVTQWASLMVKYGHAREQLQNSSELNEPQHWYLYKLDFLKDLVPTPKVKLEEPDEPEVDEPEVRRESWENGDPLASSSKIAEAPTKKSKVDEDASPKDESDIFGEFVSSQLKKISNDEVRQDAIFEIHQILHRALKKK